ncbi:MAG: hypothetical protein IPK04_06615, partial [Bdellovibrionales bacterium]|nr:hypothetical protein [Bdellovibrionales bacterium]
MLLLLDPTDVEAYERTILSAFRQTAPSFEVLIGFNGEWNMDKCHRTIEKLKNEVQHPGRTVKILAAPNTTINQLAAESQGDYVLLLRAGEWIRPDLLFRYHQTLTTCDSPLRTILYCNEFTADRFGYPVEGSYLEKPFRPEFPYLFSNWIDH